MDKSAISITLLNKEYRVACEDSERATLLDCASYLNARMEELRETRKVARFEPLALMVALNLSKELLRGGAKSATVMDHALVERIRSLRERVDHALKDSV